MTPPLSIVGSISGIGLMVAPAVFGYAGSPASDVQRAAGPVVIALSVMVHWSVLRGMRWAALAPALVLALSAVLVDQPVSGSVVSVSAAIAIAAAAPWTGPATRPTGGGWWSLVRDGVTSRT